MLAAQLDKLRTETLGQLKADGVEYEARIEALDKLERPKPLRDFTYDLFDAYRLVHPWAADHNIEPKSVARDLFERSMSFGDYVAHYGIARSEGLLLRYLSDAYKGLVQTVPEDSKTEDLEDLTEWLGELVRQVDSSLLDEWERLRHPEDLVVEAGPPAAREWTAAAHGQCPGVSGHGTKRVLPHRRTGRPPAVVGPGRTGQPVVGGALGGSHGAVFRGERLAGNGRRGPCGAPCFKSRRAPGRWRVRQVLDDPEGAHEWGLLVEVDLAASDAEGAPVVQPIGIERL